MVLVFGGLEVLSTELANCRVRESGRLPIMSRPAISRAILRPGPRSGKLLATLSADGQIWLPIRPLPQFSLTPILKTPTLKASAVSPPMVSAGEGFEVGQIVISLIAVFVVNLDALGDRAMRCSVNRSMQKLPSAITVVAAIEPPSTAAPLDALFNV